MYKSIEETFEEFYEETKKHIKMSLGVFLNINDTYYMIADTRCVVEKNGFFITKNDSTHKIVKLKNFPMVILNTGFDEFTKDHLNFEQYVYEVLEPYIQDFINKYNYFNTREIAHQISIALDDSLRKYTKDGFVVYDIKEYCNTHGNEIIILLFDNGANMNILSKYSIRAMHGESIRPESIESNFVICGEQQSHNMLQNELERTNLNHIVDIPTFITQLYHEIYESLPKEKKIINDKLDILKIQGNTFKWIQKQ